MTRDDFSRKMDFYQCENCDFIFSDALDDLNDDDWANFYRYPHYLTFDPGAAKQRRKERTKGLVKYMIEKYGYEDPSILMHGNGTCHSAKELLAEGYDVWTSFSHLQNWNRDIAGQDTGGRFDIICSIEVVEHFAYPLKEWSDTVYMLNNGGVFCGTTSLVDGVPIEKMKNNEWHYTKPHVLNAGHVSLYSAKTIDFIANVNDCKNNTERGDKELRTISHMPATSVFFQLVAK